jgi:hypothetical protein
MALPISLTLPHQPVAAGSLRQVQQERHRFAQHHESSFHRPNLLLLWIRFNHVAAAP